MKRLLSISFALLIVLSGMHFSIATHYCGGEYAATKATFSGQLASCGMEGCDECSIPGVQLKKYCCDDKVSALAVDHNFAPSFTEFTTFAQHILQVCIIPVSIELHSFTTLNLTSTDVSPPDNYQVHAVSLPKICAFLI
ncbi:MAG: hypothetical protein WAO52_20670 [Prolixibacteraceae bacterium]